ncbi:hypothetical protein ACVC7V_11765 [Hydrogenophaga sp. A37]|uniref:hypothetical protein n=1 Tax=Hydrogenophaga sp. A37 TaxID=1945864 RepID=UPI00209AECF9|nr:hypothetical protein [Hydrogenophaga sp. A37]
MRLKDELADAGKAHAESLGISFNALVAVALDAYLHGDTGPGKVKRKPVQATRPAKAKPASKAPGFIKPAGLERFDQWHPDPRNWRNFCEPDTWPYRDPDWQPPAGVKVPFEDPFTAPDDVPESEVKAFEDAYWSTHERPDRPWFEAGDIH